ncbi:MAG: hypothetical protein ACOC2L_04535 [Candidatus Sumerlaeota bacterium]
MMGDYDTGETSRKDRAVKAFIESERGAVLLEYVLLLMGCFLTIYVTIEPLKDAFLDFLTGIYQAMTLP